MCCPTSKKPLRSTTTWTMPTRRFLLAPSCSNLLGRHRAMHRLKVHHADSPPSVEATWESSMLVLLMVFASIPTTCSMWMFPSEDTTVRWSTTSTTISTGNSVSTPLVHRWDLSTKSTIFPLSWLMETSKVRCSTINHTIHPMIIIWLG